MGRPESGFWNSIKGRVPGFWQRIESPTTDGIPDCCCIVNGSTHWVELKSSRTFVSGLGTEPMQRYWMNRWHTYGGHAWVLARVGGHVIFIHAWFLPWKLDPLEDTLEHYLSKARLHAPMREFPWDEMEVAMSR